MSEPTSIEAVFWDIGGVLLNQESVKATHEAFIQELVETVSSPYAPSEALSVWRDAVSKYFSETEGTNYNPAIDGYHRGVNAVADEPVSIETWKPVFYTVFEQTVEPNPDAIEALTELNEWEVHLGIISDIDTEECERLLEQFEVTNVFDSVTTSEAVGQKKPSEAMFQTALGKAAIDGKQAMMIGDRYSHDMVGGRQAKMVTVAYGADDGPAVDHTVDSLTDIPDLVATYNSPSNQS